LLRGDEPAIAFFYAFGNTVLLASPTRTFVWKDGSPDVRTELPPLAELEIEERGAMRLPHIVVGERAVKIVLVRRDLEQLESLVAARDVRSRPGSQESAIPKDLVDLKDQIKGFQEKRKERSAQKHAALSSRLDRLQAEHDEKLAKKGEDPKVLGRKLASEMFANRSITIYENGYVKVRGLTGGRPERLLQIVSSADVTKKSGVGRAVGAVASAGWSVLGSNKRGDVYLVIVTNKTTHTLHTDMPYAHDIRSARTLEAAGLAAIATAQASLMANTSGSTAAHLPPPPATNPVSGTAAAPSPDLSAQLASLAKMHQAGELSNEEFAAAKARVLGL
jgi:hypothetical protein